MNDTDATHAEAQHETWGWAGDGYRCACRQMLTEDDWRNAERLWRAHKLELTGNG